ncbi:MAG: M1 family metallopeptidase [Chitinophagaceae bacterium]
MNIYQRILLLVTSIFFLNINPAAADNYPKNLKIDILHYTFELTLSDDTNEIIGTTTITILFKKEGVDKIRFDLVNRASGLNGKGMVVESIYEKNKKLNFLHIDNELWVDLSSIGLPNTETQLIIRYHGIPADGLRIGATKYGDRSFFNDIWPNRARHWLPTIDHPYEKATSEFMVTAPSHYQVVSNGLLIEETNLDAKTKFTHWKQSIPVSSWLYVLGVAEFAVQYVDWFEGKSIQTWVYRQDRSAGFYDFAEPTRSVVSYFSDYIGNYAYEKVANVQTPSVQGGMETSSAIFYGEELIDGKRSTRLRNVVIHELAHQWFGNAVTESTWDDAWLSEGFATYFTMLYIEHAYGRDEFVSQLLAAKTTTVEYMSKNPSYKIVDDRSAEKGPVTNGMTYQKGAWVLHMLRNLVGDSAFREGIRGYYRNFINSNASTADFRLAMEKASGRELNDFFNQWLYQGGNSALKGTWEYDAAKKQLFIKLNQSHEVPYLFNLPFEMGIYKEGNLLPQIKKFNINKKELELSIPLDYKPEKILLDPRTVLLSVTEFKEMK